LGRAAPRAHAHRGGSRRARRGAPGHPRARLCLGAPALAGAVGHRPPHGRRHPSLPGRGRRTPGPRPPPPPPPRPPAAPPPPPSPAYPQSVAGDHLYLLGATALGSVSLASHRLEWVTALPSAPTTGIARADDTLYFTTQTPAGSYVFHAFDPGTRKDRWTRALDSSWPVAPVVMGDLVATAANSDEQSLVAMARASGAVTWQARAGSVPVPPVVKGDVLYVAGQGPNRVYAFEVATGTLRWSGRL